MRIDSSGNVGIGTTSATYDFTVVGASNLSTIGTNDAALRLRADGARAMQFYTNSNEAMRIDSSGKVGIGTDSPQFDLHVHQGDSTNSLIQFTNTTTGSTSSDGLLVGIDSSEQAQIWFRESSPLRFATSDTERMRVNTDGHFLVATTNDTLYSSSSDQGMAYRASGGQLTVSRASGQPLILNRLTNDGILTDFRKNGVQKGIIGINAANNLVMGSTDSSHGGIQFGTNTVSPFNANAYLSSDNTIDLGTSAARYDDVFATNGTIQTSDRNEKQDIEDLSEAELRVATAAKGLIKKYRWIDAVEKKGDDARIHVGIIAQDLQAAFEAEGLDAGKYAMFISDTWWEADRVIPAVEANEEEGIEAVAEHTVTDTFDTQEEAPEGATERTRLGVRYPELLAFIIGAM